MRQHGIPRSTTQLAQAFLACRDDLVRYVRSLVRCSELSSDITQETFVRALATSHGTIREPRAFLFRTARNLSIDHLRHQQVRSDAADDAVEIERIAAPAPDADVALHARRQLDILKEALAELPQKRREIFMLHRFEGTSHAELAELYGVSRSMVEKHVVAALTHCRRRLHEWENGNERRPPERSM